MISGIFEVVNLAERYQMPGLGEGVKKYLETLDFKKNDGNISLVEAASIALSFTHLATLSEALLTNCAKQLKPKLGTADKMAEFACRFDGTDSEHAAFKLIAAIGKRPPPPCPVCPGCLSVPFGFCPVCLGLGLGLKPTAPIVGQSRLN